MSQGEREWLGWLKRARDRKMTQREAAERMGASERWVRQLLRRMKNLSDAVVVHGLLWLDLQRKLPAHTQEQALGNAARAGRHDFGPTFASKQLAKHHGIQGGEEALRWWMVEGGMWQPGSRKIQEVHGGDRVLWIP